MKKSLQLYFIIIALVVIVSLSCVYFGSREKPRCSEIDLLNLKVQMLAGMSFWNVYELKDDLCMPINVREKIEAYYPKMYCQKRNYEKRQQFAKDYEAKTGIKLVGDPPISEEFRKTLPDCNKIGKKEDVTSYENALSDFLRSSSQPHHEHP